MPFPFVAVTLPPDTPPAYVAALLEACTQAYGEGDCRPAGASEAPITPSGGESTGGSATAKSTPNTVSPTDLGTEPRASAEQAQPRILATVGWSDALRAEIFLGLPYWLDSRWIEWHLDFKEQDQLVERHRAVGFALGRLAVTVAEVARREREVQAAEVKPEPAAAATTPETPISPLEPPPTEAKPPVFLDPLPIPMQEDDGSEETSVHAAALLGAELGTGFRGLRIGGAGGVDLVFSNRFVLGVRGLLTGDAFHATFAGAELRGGIMWEPAPLEVQLDLGAGWNYVSARVDKTAFEHVVGGVGQLSLALCKTAISPFLGVGVSVLQEGVDTNVVGLNAYGPIVPRAQFGIKVRPDLL